MHGDSGTWKKSCSAKLVAVFTKIKENINFTLFNTRNTFSKTTISISKGDMFIVLISLLGSCIGPELPFDFTKIKKDIYFTQHFNTANTVLKVAINNSKDDMFIMF